MQIEQVPVCIPVSEPETLYSGGWSSLHDVSFVFAIILRTGGRNRRD